MSSVEQPLATARANLRCLLTQHLRASADRPRYQPSSKPCSVTFLPVRLRTTCRFIMLSTPACSLIDSQHP